VLNSRTNWLLLGLALVSGLWLFSRTKRGEALAQSGIEYADIASSRIGNLIVSRGYRNNNPGNIRYIKSNAWNGQVSNDDGFGVYDSPQNGVRALGRQLLAYAKRGLVTVRDIIGTWAPSNENDTYAYINDVANQLGIDADARFDVQARLPELAEAIARHENGYVSSDYDWRWVYL